MRHVEHEHQCALIFWAQYAKMPAAEHIKHDSVVSDYLFAIPNGGPRNKRTAVKLKKEGVKAGVSDLFLPVPMHSKAGLWIELKAPDGAMKQSQREWLNLMTCAGYAAYCAHGWEAAKTIISNYLRI
jgi:hypothetical protein